MNLNLNKSIILAFNPQWLPMIVNGDKKFEFRNKIGLDWKEGTKVYLAITKNGGGSGMIEVEFEIGKIFENNGHEAYYLLPDRRMILARREKRRWIGSGFNGQKYAIEIKNFKKYKNPIALREVYNINTIIKLFEERAREEFNHSSMCGAHKSIRVPQIENMVQKSLDQFFKKDYKDTKFDPYRIQRIPQSWCYGVIIEKRNNNA